jgi:RNA-directed DNA polymerase
VAALARVQRHGGSPGMDGRTVEELPGDLTVHGPELREAWLLGTYQPQPVKRVESPKPAGGVRQLGMPTVLDRCIQHALLQVLQPAGDGAFADGSDGFRPGRSAPHASAQAQRHLETGDSWVVDLDREQFVDRVHHDTRMSRVKEQVMARRAWQRIDRDLQAGALTGDGFEATPEGTPQGGPRSPLLANLWLDERDQELEQRGHRCVRDADAGNIDVSSARAGARVLARVTRDVKRTRKLVVNAATSAVDRPWRRTFLGFRVTARQPNRRHVSAQALKAFTRAIRRLTHRTRGVSCRQVVCDGRRYVTGWDASCS